MKVIVFPLICNLMKLKLIWKIIIYVSVYVLANFSSSDENEMSSSPFYYVLGPDHTQQLGEFNKNPFE